MILFLLQALFHKYYMHFPIKKKKICCILSGPCLFARKEFSKMQNPVPHLQVIVSSQDSGDLF